MNNHVEYLWPFLEKIVTFRCEKNPNDMGTIYNNFCPEQNMHVVEHTTLIQINASATFRLMWSLVSVITQFDTGAFTLRCKWVEKHRCTCAILECIYYTIQTLKQINLSLEPPNTPKSKEYWDYSMKTTKIVSIAEKYWITIQ